MLRKTQVMAIVFVGILFYCYEFFLRILTGAYQSEIVRYFHITTHIGFSFLISSYNLTYLVMQIPAGILLDRYGSRKCLTLATIACGIGNVLFIAGGYETAILGRLIVGIGSAFAFIGILKLSREYLPSKYFGLFAAVVISLGTLAAAFSQQISVWLTQYSISWIGVFIVCGAVAVPLAGYFWFVIPKAENMTRLLPQVSQIQSVLIAVIKNSALWLNALWAGFLYIPTVVLTSQYGIYLFSGLFHRSAYQSSELISILLMGWVVFSPVVAYLSNIVKNVRVLLSLFILFTVISLLLVLGLQPSVFVRHLSLYVFIFGIFSSAQVLVWQFFNRICPRALSGIALAMTNMIITGVTEVGQLSSGAILDFSDYFTHHATHSVLLVHGIRSMLMLFIFFVLVAWLIFLFFSRHYLYPRKNKKML